MAQGRAVPSVSTVLSIERLIAWPAQPNIDGYQNSGPLGCVRCPCNRCAVHVLSPTWKKSYSHWWETFEKARQVCWISRVCFQDRQQGVHGLFTDPTCKPCTIFIATAFLNSPIFYSLLQKKFTPNYFRILYLYVQYQRRFRIILFYSARAAGL